MILSRNVRHRLPFGRLFAVVENMSVGCLLGIMLASAGYIADV
eukprot:COSAG01_NODE_43355_length_430_cov_2.567976_1_plen_42_part_01